MKLKRKQQFKNPSAADIDALIKGLEEQVQIALKQNDLQNVKRLQALIGLLIDQYALKTNKNLNLGIGSTPKKYFEFDIVKWDETGNILLEKHRMIVQRQSLYNARTVVRKKYPVSKGYFEELNNSWIKGIGSIDNAIM